MHLEVSGNGVGKSGVTQDTGFDGQLISLFTQQLSGKMRKENKNGTSVFFDFKLAVVALKSSEVNYSYLKIGRNIYF